MADDALRHLTVDEMYGDWDYEAAVAALDRSLSPRDSTSIYDIVAGVGVGPETVILDIGSREAHRSLALAERFGCRVVAVDPVPEMVAEARVAVAASEFGDRVEVRRGRIEDVPAEDGEFDIVFSRDMFSHVADADGALAECLRILGPSGAMVLHQVFATPLLEPAEAAHLYADLAVVPERMVASEFEDAVRRSGFRVASVEVIGSEWHEASQEAGSVPGYLLQVSRLRRNREALLAELGEAPFRVMYSNALWSVYHLIGKLESRVYVLRPA